MGNLGNPWSIASCHFAKYGPSCKSSWYNIKVFSENMGHLEPIKIIIIKKCPKSLRIYGICLHLSIVSYVNPYQERHCLWHTFHSRQCWPWRPGMSARYLKTIQWNLFFFNPYCAIMLDGGLSLILNRFFATNYVALLWGCQWGVTLSCPKRQNYNQNIWNKIYYLKLLFLFFLIMFLL